MITFSSGGRLGNQLFQYVMARLLAEKLGFHLGTDWTWNNTVTFTNPAAGRKFENNRVVILEELHQKNLLELEYENRHYHLQGYWQNADYYLPYKEKIRSWILEQPRPFVKRKYKDSIVMHVRLDDYKIFGKGGNVLSQEYYLDCLAREKFDRLFIVTDGKRSDDYFYCFRGYNPIFYNGTERDDFWLVASFNKIIMGNSTFSWWAAFLSNAETIYTPKCWIRNCFDLTHNLSKIGIEINADFLDYDTETI